MITVVIVVVATFMAPRPSENGARRAIYSSPNIANLKADLS